jgi:hypothetical protein
MDERVEIPRNAKELAQYLEEVINRLENDGKISRGVCELAQPLVVASKKNLGNSSEIFLKGLNQLHTLNEDSSR